MKVALAQMEVIPGMPKVNFNNMLNLIEEAKKNQVDLIAFPELCIGGYLVGDKWANEEFCRDMMQFNKKLLEASHGIAVAYGNVYLDEKEMINQRFGDKSIHPNKDGRPRKYNAVYVIQNGKIAKRVKENTVIPAGIQPKTLLPNYRIFDDERYFFSTKDIAKDFNVEIKELMQPFEIDVEGKIVKIGFEICEDLWCEDYRLALEALNPTKMLIENGAEYIVNISASPWTYGKNGARDRRVQFLKKDSAEKFVPFYYVNCTGVQNNGKNVVTFDGGSTVYNKEGIPIIFSQKAYQQELIIINENDLLIKPKTRIENSRIAQKYEAIVRGIQHTKDLFSMQEYPRFVIGMSGGIDSAIVAALLVKAVGKDKVIGINMPTRYNSNKTKNSAKHTAEKLGIEYGVIPIEDLVTLNSETVNNFKVKGYDNQLTIKDLENLQAKIRGSTVLSNLAAKYNAIFTNNGNKVEIAIGYVTLYGDVSGAIAPIADLTKAEVIAMANYLNKEIFKKEVISKKLIPNNLWRFGAEQIQPSAELKDNQIDPMKFIYHCTILDMMMDFKQHSVESIMELYLEGTLHEHLDYYLASLNEGGKIGYELMKRWNVDDPKEFLKDIEWFTGQIQKTVFKRVQSPPIIITSKTAFGYDRRESMLPYETSMTFDELKEKILKMEKYIPRA